MATAIDASSRGKAALLHFLTQVSMWYLFSVLFNIELKKYFNLYDSPFLITFANLLVACVASAATMGRAAIVEMQVEKMIRKLTIVGVFQFIGTLSTNLSISMMAVSFTHIVKAMEPIFTLAWIVLLAKYGFSSSHSTTISKSQLLAVMGVVVGVILASISESTYSLAGLLFGLLSNVSFAGRNVLLNSVMKDYKAGKEQVFLFSSLVGCVLSLILTLMFDGKYLSTLPASGYLSLFYISVMYFLYNLISFSVLEGVTPVTHAITNCCKRLVIVFVSLLAFHIIPSPLGLVGSLVTIFGVACYSLLRNMQSENPSVTVKTFRNVVLSFIFGAIVLYLLLMSATASSSSSTAVFPTASPDIADSEEVPSWVSAYGPRGNFNPFGNSDILAKLQDKVINDFGPTFWNIKYAIFMGAPDYNNRGDSAIYIGSVYFLNLINIRIIHECAESLEWHCTWNVSQYVTKDGKSIVCLQGGGNMGDIYPYQEQKRLDYLKWAGYDKKVALFPQSIKFKNPRNWKRTEDAYNQVKEITMATRDEFSYEQMHEHFPNKKVILIPDMAFMIGHKQRAFPPKVDLLIFLRGDEERIKNLTVSYDYIPKGVSYKQNDWVQNDDAQAWDANTLYERCELRTYDAMHMLTEGKVVITDRLHAHVLTTLQDIPHVILDNSYGKVHGNHKLWTSKCKGIETAHSWEEAVDKAMVLLAQVNYYVYDNEQLKL